MKMTRHNNLQALCFGRCPASACSRHYQPLKHFRSESLQRFGSAALQSLGMEKEMYDEGKGNFPGKSTVGYTDQTRV